MPHTEALGKNMELSIQYAHYKHDEFDTRYDVEIEEVLAIFDEYKWKEEVAKANKIKECAPTISVLINSQSEMVWVSAYGDPEKPEFICECYFPGEVPVFLGFGKKQGTKYLQAQNFTKEQAREAIEIFLYKNYELLESKFA